MVFDQFSRKICPTESFTSIINLISSELSYFTGPVSVRFCTYFHPVSVRQMANVSLQIPAAAII